MLSPFQDDETPTPHVLYRKTNFDGWWYTAIDGSERCSLRWVGPCPYCHRLTAKAAGKVVGQTEEEIEIARQRIAEASGKVSGSEISDARSVESIEAEARQVEHESAAVEQHVYVYNR